MKYQQRDVFIVKGQDGTIHKITGIESAAEDYKVLIEQHNDVKLVIDVWPCEFEALK